MLEHLCHYLGNDVIIGNNGSHVVTHVGDTYIDNCSTKIKLKDFLLSGFGRKPFVY